MVQLVVAQMFMRMAVGERSSYGKSPAFLRDTLRSRFVSTAGHPLSKGGQYYRLGETDKLANN